jgi:hypothetical protein
MSSTDSETVELGAGAAMRLPIPAGASRERDDLVPAVDLSNVPGGRIVARRAYRDTAFALRAICVAAPARGWAAGVEEIILGRASQLAKEALGADVSSFAAGGAKEVGAGFEERFEGQVRREGEVLAIRGRHWLGFAGTPREALVCTVACTEPAPAHTCEAVVAAATPTGVWLEAPPPNLLARSLMLAASSPWWALAVFVAVSFVIATAVIVGRPRPRPS